MTRQKQTTEPGQNSVHRTWGMAFQLLRLCADLTALCALKKIKNLQ